MIGSVGCACPAWKSSWGAAAKPETAQTADTGWEAYVPLVATLYKSVQERPAFERMIQYEVELRTLLTTGGSAKKIAEMQALLEQARRDVTLENESIGQWREASQLAKLGILAAYGLGAAGIIYILSRALK